MKRIATTGLIIPILILCWLSEIEGYSIVEYGGVANVSTNEVALQNSAALLQTIFAANSSSTDRVVLIPPNLFFFIFDVSVSNIYNVTIKIEGGLVISNNITEWATQTGTNSLYFTSSHYITIEGGGVFDGQGYDWWWFVY